MRFLNKTSLNEKEKKRKKNENQKVIFYKWSSIFNAELINRSIHFFSFHSHDERKFFGEGRISRFLFVSMRICQPVTGLFIDSGHVPGSQVKQNENELKSNRNGKEMTFWFLIIVNISLMIYFMKQIITLWCISFNNKIFLINIEITISLFNFWIYYDFSYITISYDINCYNQNQYNQISKQYILALYNEEFFQEEKYQFDFCYWQ